MFTVYFSRLGRKYLLCSFFALTIFALGCTRTAPEQALRATIAAMQKAIESKDAAAFMKGVDARFKGASTETGELDRDGLRRTLAATLLVYPNISVSYTVREVQINGDTAQVLIDAIATSGANALPDSARHYSFDTQWNRSGSDWVLLRANWER